MRSTLLVLATLLLVIVGFVAYRWMQPLPPRLQAATGPAAEPIPVHPSQPRLGPAGQGDRPWVSNIDRMGRLASRFRAEEYVPQAGGRVHVVLPQAEFYQYTGQRVQMVTVNGDTGEIEVQQPARESGGTSGALDKGSAGPPKRGWLKRGANLVTIRLYPDVYAHPGKWSIQMTTDNLYFDNETDRVSTAATFDKDGHEIPADQVPIHVIGDYEFEGRGLNLRWNDLDGRLEYLEVAHGDYLTILHPGSAGSLFNPGGADHAKPASDRAKPAAANAPAVASPAASSAPAGAMLASNNPADAGLALPPARAPAPAPHPAARPSSHPPTPPYLATFDADVRITQGQRQVSEKQLATADLMTIDFLINSPKPATQPTTAPAPETRPAAAASAPAPAPSALSPSALSSSPETAPAPAPTTAPTSAPATQPTEAPPINVYWTGPLQVVPVETPTMQIARPALKAGESVVHLIGEKSIVHVTRDQNDVRCARLDYFSPQGSVSLRRSESFPRIVLRQLAAPVAGPASRAAVQSPAPPDAAVITTESVDYDGLEHVALLQGESEAVVQVKGDESSKSSELDAKWNKLARIWFLSRPGGGAKAGEGAAGQLTVDRAHLEGAVDVKHPQLALKSRTLDAQFDPPVASAPPAPRGPRASAATQPADAAKQPNLRQLVANEDVTCLLIDESGKHQNVECDQMTMNTAVSPLGKLYPKKVNFDGGPGGLAHAFDPSQDLHASHIQATFVPTTQPATTRPAYAAATGSAAAPPRSPATHPTTHPATTRPAELDTLTALDRVHVVTSEGATADAHKLFVKMIDGDAHARLTGAPGTANPLAKVVDAKKNVVIGPVIIADPKENTAAVEGAGTMHLIRQPSPGGVPRPIDVSFKRGAVMDSPHNMIDVLDAVSVVSPDPDGTINTATGQQVHITLADKPPESTTRPAAATRSAGATHPSATTHPSASTRPSTRPGADAQQMDVMKGKVVTGIVLSKSAVVASTLTDPKGAILRQFELKSEMIRYELTSAAPGAKGKIIVPLPGQMLTRDHRPPGAPATGADPNASPGDSRGATAFQWAKSLTYDEATHTAVLIGDVWIVHQDDAPGAEPARLRADKVVAVFEPRPNLAARPTTTSTGGAPAEQLQLKSMTATGNVVVTRGNATLNAPQMDYDPITGWMTALGSQRDPAVYNDAAGTNSATAGEIDWNAQSWNVKFKDLISRTGRR